MHIAPRRGKSQVMRFYLMSWWFAWANGYRGPMPYVIGPGWNPPRKSNSGIAPICGREKPVA
ncbi:hypothetical protein LCGC14_1614130 [marine sediment metagenome]|uniref:Uncharacterized protein n=1 Tax=marine sediment metagenome TaxID=412755 RepID=A0A0F9KN42_9ZZZZ